MAQPQGVCPACEQHVEFQAVATAAGRLFKCSNCWHHLDESQLEDLQKMDEQLKRNALERKAILERNR